MSGGRYALVVVTSQYEDPTFQALRAVGSDAFRLNDVLSDPAIGGYHVQTMADRTTWEINVSIDSFFSHKDPDDLLLFYISGHGVKSDDGQLYFVAHNTRFDLLAATGVSSRFVRERMAASRPRRIFALIDCCFSGAFGDLMTKSAGGVDVGNLAQGTGCVVLTASDSIEYSFIGGELTDQRPQLSVFTDAVVRGLRTGAADRNRDGVVDVDELFDYVYPEVRSASHGKQTPTKYTLGGVHGTLQIAKSPREPPASEPTPTPLPSPPPAPSPPPPAPSLPPPAPSPPSAPSLWRKVWAPVSAAVLLVAAAAAVFFNAGRPSPSLTPNPNPTITSSPTVTGFGAWQKAQSFGIPVEASGATVHGNRIWLLGGHSGNAPAIAAVQIFDPIRMTWRRGPDLPLALHDVVAVSDGHDLYAIGGETSDDEVIDAVYRLKRDYSGWLRDARHLPRPRAAGGVVWDGSRIVYAGGIDAQERDVADVFTLGRTGWTRLDPLKNARNSIAATTDGRGTAWFMTGQTGWRSDVRTSGQVDVLKAGTVAVGRSVTSRRAAAAIYLPGIGPCVLGGSGSAVGAAVECPLNRSGVQPPDLLTQRAGLCAVVSSGQVWAFGGFYAKYHNSAIVERLPFGTS